MGFTNWTLLWPLSWLCLSITIGQKNLGPEELAASRIVAHPSSNILRSLLAACSHLSLLSLRLGLSNGKYLPQSLNADISPTEHNPQIPPLFTSLFFSYFSEILIE